MQTVLIAIHLIIVVALVAVVLLQRSEGGALGMGGGGGFMTGRGQANVLTRATAILAALFFATSLGLTLLANYGRANRSILEGVTPGTSQPVSTLPPKGQGSVLDQLQQIEKQRSSGGAGFHGATPNPAQPATATPAPAAVQPVAPKAAAPVEPTGIPSKPASEAPMSPKAEGAPDAAGSPAATPASPATPPGK